MWQQCRKERAISTITRTTIARKIRELFAEEKSYGAWSHGGSNRLSDSEYRQIAYRKAWDEILPPYGWPGGYAIAYYLPSAEVLCSDCAREFLRQNKDLYADMGESFTIQTDTTDGYEGDDSADHLYCDDCGKVICRAWLRPPGHPSDADLTWAELRWLRATDRNDTNPLAAIVDRKRYQPRHWSGKRRTRQFARRYSTRVATLAIWRYRAAAA